MATARIKQKKGFGLIDTILTIALGIILFSTLYVMTAIQRRQSIITERSEKDAKIWFNFVNAVQSYASSNNLNNQYVSCNTLVSDNLLAPSQCQDIFGNTLAGYIKTSDEVYAYIGSYSSSYSASLHTIGLGNTGSLQSFYSDVLSVLTKLGEAYNAQYDVIFTNNTYSYDMEYRLRTNNTLPFSAPPDPVEGYYPVVRMIVY